jgi:hypothetical protein
LYIAESHPPLPFIGTLDLLRKEAVWPKPVILAQTLLSQGGYYKTDSTLFIGKLNASATP